MNDLPYPWMPWWLRHACGHLAIRIAPLTGDIGPETIADMYATLRRIARFAGHTCRTPARYHGGHAMTDLPVPANDRIPGLLDSAQRPDTIPLSFLSVVIGQMDRDDALTLLTGILADMATVIAELRAGTPCDTVRQGQVLGWQADGTPVVYL